MASYKSAFGSYIKADDLQGKAVRVSIDRVELETIKGGEGKSDERKLVAHFTGKDKGLALNRTNAETLAEIFGDEDYDNWVGSVILFPDTTMFGGKKVPCVRIRANAQAAPPKPVEPEPEPEDIDADSIPFAWLLPLVLPALGAISYIA